jgi:5'-nucleotidase/UDP-sugar diphosphatase
MTVRNILFIATATLCTIFTVHAFAATGTVEISILHTTDLHGRILPVTDYGGNENVGGLGRLSTLIRQRRLANTNSILVDNGDSLQGGVPSYLTSGSIYIDAMNALDYQLWNLGNHEFDWGVETLALNISRFSNTVLSANTHLCGSNSLSLATVLPYSIREIGGRRIAFIGVNHPKIPFWSRPVLLRNTIIESPVPALLRIMTKVRKKEPDAVVLLAHMGYHTKSEEFEEWLDSILKLFPDIDVVIGGHTHQAVPSLLIGSTLYTQAAYHGTYLGEVRLIFNIKSGDLVSKSAQLIPAGANIKPDLAFQRYYAAAEMMGFTQSMKKICYINGVLCSDIPVDKESPEQTLIAEAIADAVTADIVFHGAFRGGEIISNEVMTAADIFSIVPYENRIVYAYLTPIEISRVLDSLVKWWGTRHFAFPYGLQTVIDTNGCPGERVVTMTDMNGQNLAPEKRYKVAFNSYMAASGGKRFLPLRAVIDARNTGVGAADISTRDAVMNYLEKKKKYTPHVVKSVSHVKKKE